MDILNPEEDFEILLEQNVPIYDPIRIKYNTIILNLLHNSDKAKIFFNAFLETKNGFTMYDNLDMHNRIVFDTTCLHGSIKSVIYILRQANCNYKKMIQDFKPSFQIFKLFLDIQHPNLIKL